LTLLRKIAEELAGPGTFAGFTAPHVLPYTEWNKLMAGRDKR
jgi:hypothetical protein